MRILLLIVQFPPDVNSTGLLMAQVCEGLIAHGHEVSVVTTFPHYEKFRVWDEYRGKLAERAQYRGMDVLRLYTHATGNKRRFIPDRLLSYLSFNALATAANLLSRRSYDVVLCTNGSFFSGMTSALTKAFKGIPFVFNVQDLYPDTVVNTGQLRDGPAIRVLERLARFMYHQAAHVTVITPSFRDSLLAKGVPAEKISVIPNFVDTEFIRPLPKDNEFSRRHGLADRFVVAHAGNVGYVYDLDTMLDAAALLRSEKDLLFLIVGNGVARPELEQKARALSLENVRFLPYQPHADLPWLRAASDVQVSLYKHRTSHNSMPSKIYEIMASGRPLIASAAVDSDVWSLARSTQCGLCVVPENPGKLAEAVLTLYHDRPLAQTMADHGRRHAEQRYSKEVVIAQYHELLQQVGARSRARS